MSPIGVYLAFVVSAVADIATFAAIIWWSASRKRLAAETVGRAEEHVRQIRQQAEREAETLKKEAQLEIREKTHALMAETDHQGPKRHGEMMSRKQALADRTRALADRIASAEKLERDLRVRDA